MALTATDLFNDATTREIGGVGPDQVNLIVSDLIGVQQMLSAALPQVNNLTDLHMQVIINQLNEEIASVENANAPTTGTLTLGTDLGQFVGRSINDIHRDIIDIAQGDAGVQALFNPTPLPDLNTPPAPFHDSADQTTFVTQWIQDSNHLGQMAQTIANNGFTGDIAGLVQQIQTFNNNSNAFDMSQGGLFSARFWNEFRTDGTSGTAATALIQGLQTHNAGEVAAAVEQLAANSADVASNNRMADGGSYADVVAAAQATAVTPTGGDPGGPPDGGGGGGPAAGVLNPGDLYFANMFNDATRILEGGLWHNNVSVGNQGHGTDGRYIADLQLVQTGLTADVAANDFAGDQLTHVNTVLADITTALAAVPGAVNNDPNAESALRTAHLDIINTIENDPVLQALSIKDDNPGFNFAPPELATPLNANTPHATFAELGAIFDDAQSKSLGGINANNLPAIQADLQTVRDGLVTLMNDHPQLFGGATGVHASTIVDQINLQLNNFDNQYGFNPDAAKATNDNFLDITDIVWHPPMASPDGQGPRLPTLYRSSIRTMLTKPTSGPTSLRPATRSVPGPSNSSPPARRRTLRTSFKHSTAGRATSQTLTGPRVAYSRRGSTMSCSGRTPR